MTFDSGVRGLGSGVTIGRTVRFACWKEEVTLTNRWMLVTHDIMMRHDRKEHADSMCRETSYAVVHVPHRRTSGPMLVLELLAGQAHQAETEGPLTRS